MTPLTHEQVRALRGLGLWHPWPPGTPWWRRTPRQRRAIPRSTFNFRFHQ